MCGGNDEAHAMMWGDLSGSAEVLFKLKGGDGNDLLFTWGTFDIINNGYESIDIAQGSVFNIRLEGGDGDDETGTLYSGRVNGQLKCLELGGLGNDNLSTALNPTSGSEGALDAKLFGEDGDDVVDFTLDDNSGGFLYIQAAVLHGGTGFDTGTATPNVAIFGCEA
jgi:hypothetical protein